MANSSLIPRLKTPGVYIEEISLFPPSVAQVETAIPAFIGYTQKAGEKKANDLNLKPKRIVSMLEYVSYFGTAEFKKGITVTINRTTEGDENNKKITAETYSGSTALETHNMYYALQAFYANGGGPCYIVSVGLIPSDGQLPNDMKDKLKEGLNSLEQEDEVTLIVFPEIQSIGNDAGDLWVPALNQCGKLQDRFLVTDIFRPIDGNIEKAAKDFRDIGLPSDFLKYGAAYTPNVLTSLSYIYEDKDVDVRVVENGGDPGDPVKLITFEPSASAGADAARYNQCKAAISRIPVELPVAPLVVGQYARVDSTRGVWKAPANVTLALVREPTIKITHEQQADLNIHTTGKSINAIRTFAGKGTLIWGARTLAGNDNEWRYIPVRRFFNMVEESVKKATEPFVFEPNDKNTWVKVRAMIENFLTLQWRAGALAGAVPEHAFFVKVGLNETMTALDILEGRMIVEIGMAVVRPAEFIILQFMHKMQES